VKSISRRDWLASTALGLPGLPGRKGDKSILVHEHVLVDFAGANIASPSRYNRDEVIAAAKPKLEAIAKLGCVRLIECTPNYLGRDPILLARLSAMTGVELWTNTGLYAANAYKHLPRYAWEESALQLSKRWVAEWKNGIEGTKPRFIKIGVNAGALKEMDRKIVEAGAYTMLETGLTLGSHTGPPVNGASPALQQIELLEKLRMPLKKFVWIHAQNEKDHAIHEQAARKGVWVEFDGINERSAQFHLDCVQFMAKKKLLDRTLISQDSGWYRVGEPGGGKYNGYDYIYTGFVPQLEKKWVKRLLWDNPRAAFGE
jgi:phosphotriesterase-related protein